MFEYYDARDREPRRTERAQGPFESQEQAEQAADLLNDYVHRSTGLRPFCVRPARSQVRLTRISALLVDGRHPASRQ